MWGLGTCQGENCGGYTPQEKRCGRIKHSRRNGVTPRSDLRAHSGPVGCVTHKPLSDLETLRRTHGCYFKDITRAYFCHLSTVIDVSCEAVPDRHTVFEVMYRLRSSIHILTKPEILALHVSPVKCDSGNLVKALWCIQEIVAAIQQF